MRRFPVNMPVLVDWLTLILAPLVLIGLGLAFYAARSVRGADGARVPTWGRVVQGMAIAGALFIAFIRILWGA